MKAKDFFKKHLGDLILGTTLLAISCALLGYYLWPRSSDNLYAYVYHQSTQILDPISLAGEDKEYPIEIHDENTDMHMVVTLKDHQVAVTESNCKNQSCVRQGYISSPAQTIICSPNQIYVYIRDMTGKEITVIDV